VRRSCSIRRPLGPLSRPLGCPLALCSLLAACPLLTQRPPDLSADFDFDHIGFGAPPNATAIQINGNDHFIFDTIVFSSKIGVEVNGVRCTGARSNTL
jgi:hypothetical protein